MQIYWCRLTETLFKRTFEWLPISHVELRYEPITLMDGLVTSEYGLFPYIGGKKASLYVIKDNKMERITYGDNDRIKQEYLKFL